jgi:acyl carrier protein
MSVTETAVLNRIADIWRDLLDRPDLALTGGDNFFTLGATSLQAMSMVEQLGAEFGVPVSIFAVTESPELGALADHVTELLHGCEVGEL